MAAVQTGEEQGSGVCRLSLQRFHFKRRWEERRGALAVAETPEEEERRSPAVAFAMGGDDDDDDFQEPVGYISLAKRLVPWSVKGASRGRRESSGSLPLGPSNGANRPRKRVKVAPAVGGKENREVSRKIQRQLSAAMGDKAEVNPTPHRAAETLGNPSVDSCAFHEIAKVGEVKRINAVEESSEARSSQAREIDGGRERETCSAQKESYCCIPIEVRLLGPCLGGGEGMVDDCQGEDLSEDIEAGTQLKELMNLCSELDEGGNLDYGSPLKRECLWNFGGVSYLRDGYYRAGGAAADCPHESLPRQRRTGEGKVTVSSKERNPSSDKPAVDSTPLIQWLKTLGLSRYEEVFVREEIDWDTLQCLTEEDLLNLGIDALGPGKRIVHALNGMRGNSHSGTTGSGISNANSSDKAKQFGGNKLITEFFRGPRPVQSRCQTVPEAPPDCGATKPPRKVERANKETGRRGHRSSLRYQDIPAWCCIPGTPFRVDAFRYLWGDCSHWFLTHFHLDHYQGLTRSFRHGKIYCSSITARLLNSKIGIDWNILHVLPLNERINISGVEVTCVDANHCPGSIIILFEPPNGKPVLHTGDFRYCEDLGRCPILRSCRIHTLILDTTYCNPQYDFPRQDAVVQFIVEAIQAEAFNPKTLFLIGSYTIGKERIFLEIARVLRKKVYVGAEDMDWLTENEMESHVHVVPMWTIASFKRMNHLWKHYSNRFDLMVAFSPTGWSYGKGKKKKNKALGTRWQQGTIIRYEVPYSEHSSFTELREFVRLISPDIIIPSVNNTSPEAASAWLPS
ncbi:unnamed protein product [Spirodela intermedia]|uniref:SAM domain-containing protein n=1 Tax=Spirodela intermedia TaxID=51605 RepID=A0A7I8J2B8_SPIIN|nr:unnamed protein product [Spirodela intermedia]CAA6664209.1 unnamed protein product [Spirodela intermedia]